MLTKEENELITRVGPGTPMGDMLRQYWLPAAMSSELPAPDCTPLRLRILGENLIAFRITSGQIGVIADACPHRGASMFFGRNEENGLRCVYHGWKFDVGGNCVDMPSEPAESNFREKVKATAYRTQERNNLIWLYMGTSEVLPELPQLAGNLPPEGMECHIAGYFSECNWMQSLEGDFDTIHVGFLHGGSVRAEELPAPNDPAFDVAASRNYYAMRTRWAWGIVSDIEIGCTYGNYRPAEEDSTYWRIHQFGFPFYSIGHSSFLAIVPMDDEHTMRWNVGWRAFGSSSLDRVVEGVTTGYAGSPENNSTDWLGRFRPAANRHNDYLIDREVQRANQGVWGYTGIPGRAQDGAVTESMGVIYQRNREHLGVTDSGIIRMRRRLINAARALHDSGATPPGVEKPDLYCIRPVHTILPKGVPGIEATRAEQWSALTEESPKLEART